MGFCVWNIPKMGRVVEKQTTLANTIGEQDYD